MAKGAVLNIDPDCAFSCPVLFVARVSYSFLGNITPGAHDNKTAEIDALGQAVEDRTKLLWVGMAGVYRRRWLLYSPGDHQADRSHMKRLALDDLKRES